LDSIAPSTTRMGSMPVLNQQSLKLIMKSYLS
jgi:hypothetical protein